MPPPRPANFFTGRTHQTKIETDLSDLAVLLSSVVQGSGIGPLMLLVYINELIYILEEFNINVNLFADDVKMYMKIINDTNITQLQRAVTFLVNWAHEWQLSISVDKCILNIGQQVVAPHITINNSVLPLVPSVRDLGVVVCADLSTTAHVADIVAKAHKRANLTLRAFVSCDIKVWYGMVY